MKKIIGKYWILYFFRGKVLKIRKIITGSNIYQYFFFIKASFKFIICNSEFFEKGLRPFNSSKNWIIWVQILLHVDETQQSFNSMRFWIIYIQRKINVTHFLFRAALEKLIYHLIWN